MGREGLGLGSVTKTPFWEKTCQRALRSGFTPQVRANNLVHLVMLYKHFNLIDQLGTF